MLSLVSCAAAAAFANTQFDMTIASTAVNSALTTQQFYLGIGRYVKINTLTVTGTGVNVRVAYAPTVLNQSVDLTCNTAACTAQSTVNLLNPIGGVAQCRRRDFTNQTIDSFSCVRVFGNTLFSSPNVDPAVVSTTTPYYYKAHERSRVHMFIEYDVPATGAWSITFNARVKSPEDLYCVQQVDRDLHMAGTQFPQPAPSAVRSQVIMDGTNTTLPVATRTNFYNFDLGVSPAVRVGCLTVLTTPVTAPNVDGGACASGQVGTDFAGASGRVVLRDTYPCTVHTNATSIDDPWLLPVGLFGSNAEDRALYHQCCRQRTVQNCLAVGSSLSRTEAFCLWNTQDETCYPTFGGHTKDLSEFAGLNGTFTRTFQSLQANTPRSSFVAERHLVVNGYQVQNERKWHLIVTNPLPAQCPQVIDISYTKDNTGGICEPSTRALCDTQEQRAITGLGGRDRQLPFPLYWPLSNIADEEFSVCNALKQKEICYRKNGCLSAKRYELILQNCLEAGCGNYCNSGAMLQASVALLVALVFAVIA